MFPAEASNSLRPLWLLLSSFLVWIVVSCSATLLGAESVHMISISARRSLVRKYC